MTPFGQQVVRYLRHRQMRQRELAHAIHVHPTYLSALFHGRKGQPSAKIIDAVSNALRLAPIERSVLESAARDSFRFIELPTDANTAERRLAIKLVSAMGHLHPGQLEAMESILNLTQRTTGITADLEMNERETCMN